ncbi:hypothetical protein BaRGS_00039732 [Batillaria attramentaria]|uniref:C2H2-type domain-containing protein n=1 Tax=Batillaria attramentaria TaxID=370345 RepID=A0ABD0J2U5_9CAEN
MFHDVQIKDHMEPPDKVCWRFCREEHLTCESCCYGETTVHAYHSNKESWSSVFQGRPASIVSAKRKEMFDTDPVTVDARVASASSTATLLTQTNREESRDSLQQPYRKKSTRLMRKTADKKRHNAAEGKRQKEDSFITSHSSSTSAVLDQPPSIVPKPEPEDDRVVSSDKTQTKRLKIARRDTSYVARSRLAPRDKAQGNETDCEICGCAPGGTHILKLHMPDCVCKVCNMECNTEKLLEAHMRTHKTAAKKLHIEKKKHVREKKPRVKEKEVCHVCGLSLNKSRMQHHMLRHGSVKDHVCQTCGKAYYDLKALRRHEAVHGGQRYVCPTCGKTSNTQENLSKHAKRCKGAPETFKCQLCPEEFSVKRELDNHMYAHRVAQAEKHACAVCGREYSERFHLTRHMQKAHQAELEPAQ